MYSTHRSLTAVHTILLRNDDLCLVKRRRMVFVPNSDFALNLCKIVLGLSDSCSIRPLCVCETSPPRHPCPCPAPPRARGYQRPGPPWWHPYCSISSYLPLGPLWRVTAPPSSPDQAAKKCRVSRQVWVRFWSILASTTSCVSSSS